MKQPLSRPPLQPLLFWEVCLLLFAAGILAARFWVPAAAFLLLIVWVDSRMRRPLSCLLALMCVGAGWHMGIKAEPEVPRRFPVWLEQSLAARRAVPVTGTVIKVRGLPDRRLQILLENVAPEQGEPLPGKLALTWQDSTDAPRPLPGQRLSGKLHIRPVRGFRNRGAGNIEDYWHRQGVFFQAWTKGDEAGLVAAGKPAFGSALRERLRLRVEQALKNQEWPLLSGAEGGRAVIPALLFGDRSGLHTADLERINAAGLAHSLALSGQHLAVAGLGALALTMLLGFAAPGVFLRVPAHSLMGILSLPLAAGYLWLGDAPPSLLRATLMLAAACLLRCVPDLLPARVGRLVAPFSLIDFLLMALLCMLLADPLCLYDLGAQLSFAAVTGIALALPWFRAVWQAGPFSVSPLHVLTGEKPALHMAASRALRLLWLTFGCSAAAQLATLPIVLDAFGRSTLWFPLNLLWLPVLGAFVLPLSFLGLLFAVPGSEAAASLALQLAALPCGWLLEALRWLQMHLGMDTFVMLRPHWSFLPGLGAIAAGMALRLNRPAFPAASFRLFAAGGIFLLAGPLLWAHGYFSPRIALRVLDVGQGQAVLVEWSHGGKALIDGGGLASRRFDTGRDILSPILTANSPPRLEALFLSHPDRDHLKGLLYIAQQYAVGKVYTAPLEGIDAPSGPARPLAEAFTGILAERGIPRLVFQK